MIPQCAAQVQERLPETPRPEQQALALLVDGVVVVSGRVGLCVGWRSDAGGGAGWPQASNDGRNDGWWMVERALGRCHGAATDGWICCSTRRRPGDGDLRGDGDALFRAGVAAARATVGLARLGGGTARAGLGGGARAAGSGALAPPPGSQERLSAVTVTLYAPRPRRKGHCHWQPLGSHLL
jgi:hypothetical protein